MAINCIVGLHIRAIGDALTLFAENTTLVPTDRTWRDSCLRSLVETHLLLNINHNNPILKREPISAWYLDYLRSIDKLVSRQIPAVTSIICTCKYTQLVTFTG